MTKYKTAVRKHASAPIEKINNLSFEKLDRIYRFLKLSRKLNWSFEELDWALRSLGKPFIPEKAILLDGLSDYIVIDNFKAFKRTLFSIEAWVKPITAGINPIICKGNESSQNTHFCFWIDQQGRLSFNNSEKGNHHGIQPVPLGTFSHVAMTLGGGNLHFYINGVLDRKIKLTISSTPGSDLNIGRNLNDEYFSGCIKEVRIWEKILTTSDIQNRFYKKLIGNEADLFSYWPITEDRWYAFMDQSSNHNDGRMGGENSLISPSWVRHPVQQDYLSYP